MSDYSLENQQNAEIILNFLLQTKTKKVLDICCGVFDDKGINYDEHGQIYQPLVAQNLGINGFDVVGIDFRENETKQKIHYKPISQINILDARWTSKLDTKFAAIIFLRSWDTPEILFYFQDKFKTLNLNELSIKIAKKFLPDFKKILSSEGFFITSEIFNFGLCENNLEIKELEKLTLKIFCSLGFDLLEKQNGIYFLKYISN